SMVGRLPDRGTVDKASRSSASCTAPVSDPFCQDLAVILSLVVAANFVMPTATACVGAIDQQPAFARPLSGHVPAMQREAVAPADSALLALYASGTDFATFLAAAE